MKPYGTNMHGHANKCDCTKCAQTRRKAFAQRIAAIAKLDDKTARLPTDSSQTVFVRAHFKRSPNHLSKYPRTLRLIRKTLKGAL